MTGGGGARRSGKGKPRGKGAGSDDSGGGGGRRKSKESKDSNKESQPVPEPRVYWGLPVAARHFASLDPEQSQGAQAQPLSKSQRNRRRQARNRERRKQEREAAGDQGGDADGVGDGDSQSVSTCGGDSVTNLHAASRDPAACSACYGNTVPAEFLAHFRSRVAELPELGDEHSGAAPLAVYEVKKIATERRPPPRRRDGTDAAPDADADADSSVPARTLMVGFDGDFDGHGGDGAQPQPVSQPDFDLVKILAMRALSAEVSVRNKDAALDECNAELRVALRELAELRRERADSNSNSNSEQAAASDATQTQALAHVRAELDAYRSRCGELEAALGAVQDLGTKIESQFLRPIERDVGAISGISAGSSAEAAMLVEGLDAVDADSGTPPGSPPPADSTARQLAFDPPPR